MSYCSVPLCKGSYRKKNSARENPLWFHKFPKDPVLRKKWLIKIRRDVGPNFRVTQSSRVCSAHFVSSDYRPFLRPKIRCLKAGVVPSVFQWTDLEKLSLNNKRSDRCESRAARGKQQNVETSRTQELPMVSDNQEVFDIAPECPIEVVDNARGTAVEALLMLQDIAVDNKESPQEQILQTTIKELQLKIAQLELEKSLMETEWKLKMAEVENEKKLVLKEKEELKQKYDNQKHTIAVLKRQILCPENILHDKELVTFYTGLPDSNTFTSLVEYLRPKAEKLQYWNGGSTKETPSYQERDIKKPGAPGKLTNEEELFLVLVRLKLGLPRKEIARIFSISEATVTRIFTTWITFMHFELKMMFRIPPIEEIHQATPPHFSKYPDTTLIIDCTDIKIQRPFMLKTQRETFSTYKHGNTFKFLIGITPAGLVCFISELYGGATSDKKIVAESGLLKLLHPGHSVMADKGFDIADILPSGVKLNVPPRYMKRLTGQIPVEDVKTTRCIASVRVEVERAIRRMKTFTILGKALPLSLCDVAEQIVNVCAFLTNFKPALTKNK